MESQVQGCCVELANRAFTTVRSLRDQAPAFSVRIIDAEAPNSSSDKIQCVAFRSEIESNRNSYQFKKFAGIQASVMCCGTRSFNSAKMAVKPVD